MKNPQKRGIDLLLDPSLNKSTAFTEFEKEALGLIGLVPDVTETEDLQLQVGGHVDAAAGDGRHDVRVAVHGEHASCNEGWLVLAADGLSRVAQ